MELVLAADRSGSMPMALLEEQRRGFAAAFRDEALQRAVISGPLGQIAVLYFEWSDQSDQQIIVPWSILGTPDDMNAFADDLERIGIDRRGGQTSISGAMFFARHQLQTNAVTSYRKVVDISGNGRDNVPVQDALQSLRSVGVTVNGLVLPQRLYGETDPYDMLFIGYDGPLEAYYRREVIGGPGAFAIAVDPAVGFSDAILRKLVLEVAWSSMRESAN